MANPSATAHRHPSEWWHPTDYLRILYKRRWVALPAFLLVFISGTLETIRAVPIYEARTQLVIEPDVRRTTSIDDALEDRSRDYSDEFYVTQYRIIESRSLALRTVETLEKGGRPERVPSDDGYAFTLSGVIDLVSSSIAGLLADEDASPKEPTATTAAADETSAQSRKVDAFL